jgi:lysophospholipase L1-like esterase
VQAKLGWLTDDPHLPYKPKPGSRIRGTVATGEYEYDHQHNRLGFRDVEHTTEKPPGTFRILGVGDSFTAGWGAPFDRTYLSCLQRSLANRTGEHAPVEIIQAGINGYFPETERLVVEHYGLAFEPDLVVVGFLPNDVLDTVRGIDAVVLDKQGVLTSREAADLGSLGVWAYRNLHCARIVLRAWTRHRGKTLRPDWWRVIYEPDAEFEAGWREVERQYERLARSVRAAGARLVVLHIPENLQDDPLFRYPSDRLRVWCQRHDVAFVDAAPSMRAAARASDAPIYYERDRHCTPAGYAAIAAALEAGLIEQGLLP